MQISGNHMGMVLVGYHMSEDWSAFAPSRASHFSQNHVMQNVLTHINPATTAPVPALYTQGNDQGDQLPMAWLLKLASESKALCQLTDA
jgi:hypothetical protein